MVPPTTIGTSRCNLSTVLEVTANYRVSRGIEDPVSAVSASEHFSDKGANLKFALFHPEDSGIHIPALPSVLTTSSAHGACKARYIVLTQVFLKQKPRNQPRPAENAHRGFFAASNGCPSAAHAHPWLENLALVVEYDAIPYKSKKREPHPMAA